MDAMDLLYLEKVDAFCIVSSDCGFTGLVGLESVRQMRRGEAAHVTEVNNEAARRAEAMDRGLTKRVAADEVHRQAQALLR